MRALIVCCLRIVHHSARQPNTLAHSYYVKYRIKFFMLTYFCCGSKTSRSTPWQRKWMYFCIRNTTQTKQRRLRFTFDCRCCNITSFHVTEITATTTKAMPVQPTHIASHQIELSSNWQLTAKARQAFLSNIYLVYLTLHPK